MPTTRTAEPSPAPRRRPIIRRLLVALAVVAVAWGIWLVLPHGAAPQERLTQLYTPAFSAPPPPQPASETLARLAELLRSPSGGHFIRSLLPGQSGVLWLSLVVALAVAFNLRSPRDPRNVDLALSLGMGLCFFDILGFLDRLADPTQRQLMDWVFLAVGAMTIALLVRAVWRVRHPNAFDWRPNLDTRALAGLAVLLFVLSVVVALAYPPDDAGYFINIGAQRLRERLWLPYGDPLLSETPAAAYGPLLYLAHIPFQVLLAPHLVNPHASAHPPLGPASEYFLPPLLATQLTLLAFHAIGVFALFKAADRLGGRDRAWAVTALYCGSAFVLGVGDGDYAIGGVTFISHIAPTAVTLAAFAAAPWPAAAGALLAAGIGTLFYPIFMFPAWMGFYWRDGLATRRFVAGFVVASLLVGGFVLLRSRPANGRGVIGTVLWDTLGHQESPKAYGSSPFGLWGQREGWRAVLMRPIVEGQNMTRPVVLAFFAFAVGTFWLARGRGQPELALVLAAVAMGAELWKVHATATYVTWYYPFLLIGLFGGGGAARPGSLDARPEPCATPRETIEAS